jgi:hypothetical protein
MPVRKKAIKADYISQGEAAEQDWFEALKVVKE